MWKQQVSRPMIKGKSKSPENEKKKRDKSEFEAKEKKIILNQQSNSILGDWVLPFKNAVSIKTIHFLLPLSTQGGVDHKLIWKLSEYRLTFESTQKREIGMNQASKHRQAQRKVLGIWSHLVAFYKVTLQEWGVIWLFAIFWKVFILTGSWGLH